MGNRSLRGKGCLRSGIRGIREERAENFNYLRSADANAYWIGGGQAGFAREVANRIVFIDGGVVVEDGMPDKIFNAAEHRRTREFLDKIL